MFLVFSSQIISIIITNVTQKGTLHKNIVQIGIILLLAVPSTAYITAFSITSNDEDEKIKIQQNDQIISSPQLFHDENIYKSVHSSDFNDSDSDYDNNNNDNNSMNKIDNNKRCKNMNYVTDFTKFDSNNFYDNENKKRSVFNHDISNKIKSRGNCRSGESSSNCLNNNNDNNDNNNNNN